LILTYQNNFKILKNNFKFLRNTISPQRQTSPYFQFEPHKSRSRRLVTWKPHHHGQGTWTIQGQVTLLEILVVHRIY
jgi:hypothetical protein